MICIFCKRDKANAKNYHFVIERTEDDGATNQFRFVNAQLSVCWDCFCAITKVGLQTVEDGK